MPVSVVKQLHNNTFLIVWEITETNDELQDLLHARLHDWNATEQHRENKHWLASRLCILEHFRNEEVDLLKDKFNKPHLKVDEHDVFVSITHSYDKAAVIVSLDHPVSLDIERVDVRIDRVKHKFCKQTEHDFATGSAHPIESLVIIWSAKETIYKWYGKKELDFKQDMEILPFELSEGEYTISGKLRKNGTFLDIAVRVEISDGYCLTYIA